MTYRFNKPMREIVRQFLMQGPRPVRLKKWVLADQLKVSPSTIEERLRNEGTRWTEVKDDVLMILDAQCGGASDEAIAKKLGFGSVTALRVARRRWIETYF